MDCTESGEFGEFVELLTLLLSDDAGGDDGGESSSISPQLDARFFGFLRLDERPEDRPVPALLPFPPRLLPRLLPLLPPPRDRAIASASTAAFSNVLRIESVGFKHRRAISTACS